MTGQSDEGTTAGRWETFSHSADVGVRGTGATKEQAFEKAAMALTSIVTELELVEPGEEIQLACEAPDDELLLVDWLNALVYEMSTRQMLFRRSKVQIRRHALSAQAWGEQVSPEKHHPAVEVKGATLTELKVSRDASGTWTAQCVVDV